MLTHFVFYTQTNLLENPVIKPAMLKFKSGQETYTQIFEPEVLKLQGIT